MISNTVAETTSFYDKIKEPYSYNAYGLNIHSALPLPELGTGNGKADVIVRFGTIDGLPPGARDEYRYVQANAEEIRLAWQGVGAFLVRGGREIIVDPNPEVEEHVLRLFVLGTSLALLLHQRGKAVILHASVVAISGQAVAFVGKQGTGKSTMAATLHARGHDLVADDILAIDMNQARPVALPGFPYFKLWPDSIASLGYTPDTLPRLRPETEKRGRRLNTGFLATSVPLKCIYVLSQGPEPEIVPLCSRDALGTLMPHWYGARFGKDLLQALGLSTHLLECTNLVKKVAVCNLKRPLSLPALSDVARLVEEHVGCIP